MSHRESPELRQNLAGPENSELSTNWTQTIGADSLRGARGTRSYLTRPLATHVANG
jgi:hypothetical protein